jgi:hypothetical protein
MIPLWKEKNPIYFGIITIIPFDNLYRPKINRVLPLPQGNHVVKFGKDPIFRTKVMWKRPIVKNYIYSNGDFDL